VDHARFITFNDGIGNLYEAANEFREIEPWRVIDDTDWQIISIVRNHRGRNGSVTSLERIGV
jgi:hypothetical protein